MGVEGGQSVDKVCQSVSQEAKQSQCYASNGIEISLQSEHVLICFMLASILFYDGFIFTLYHSVLLLHFFVINVLCLFVFLPREIRRALNHNLTSLHFFF